MAVTRPDSQVSETPSAWLLALLSAVPFVVQLIGLIPRGYSYFIDEFYYFACASRPAFGYVDHPPLAPLILALTRPVLGESLLGLRLVPFLAGSATVWVTGLVVARLGGQRFAVVLACITVGLAPLFLGMSGFFSMNAFEPLLWMLIVLVVVRIVQSGDSKLWMLVGMLVGLSFENKHTAMVYVVALMLGVVATRTRRILADRWVWAGAAIALVLAIPNVWWQVVNGFPSIEFYRNAQFAKNIPSPPLRSLATLAVVMNPLTVPVWIAGFVFLLGPRGGRVFRFLGVTCAILLVAQIASQTSRPDRVAGMFPILIAAGAVAVERVMLSRAVRATYVGVAAVLSFAIAPIVLPLLSPPVLARYTAALGMSYSAERGISSPIPQILADRTGWESFVDQVARVYEGMSAEDRAHAVIYAPSYGMAGAIELLGRAKGLPRVIGGHNTYWLWSRGHVNTDVLIGIDTNEARLRKMFRDVQRADNTSCEYCMSWRNGKPIFVARGSAIPIDTIWDQVRHYE